MAARAGLARSVLTAKAVQPPTRSFALRSAESAPSNVVALPLVLLLGCEPELEARCRSLAARGRALARALPLSCQRSEVIALRPLVIVVEARAYEAVPWSFEVLAEKAGAQLLVLGREPIAPIVLEYQLNESMCFASRVRSRVGRPAAERAQTAG